MIQCTLARMGLSLFDSVYWATTAFLEVAVFGPALRRRLFARLPFFTLYLGLVIADEAILWLTYRLIGIRSRISFDVYWTSQALLVLSRAVVVYEICRALLWPFAGIWKLCRPLLVGLGLILVVSAVATARRTVHPISATTLMADRGLELTVAGVLLFGLIFCRYYGVEIPWYLAWIALGLGVLFRDTGCQQHVSRGLAYAPACFDFGELCVALPSTSPHSSGSWPYGSPFPFRRLHLFC